MRIAPFALALLFACNEYQLKDEDEPSDTQVPLGEPDIRVEPASVDFGTLSAGQSATEVLTVTNVGDALLGLDGVCFQGSGPFSFTQVESVLLTAGQATTFTASFEPDRAGSFAAELWVESADPDTPRVVVPLTGAATGPDLVLDPLTYDFGTLGLWETAAMDLTLRNEGSSTLTIANWAYDASSDELSLDARGLDVFPIALEPGEELTVGVKYVPTDAEPDEGFLLVRSDDPLEPEATASQQGNGTAPESFETAWYVWDDGLQHETMSSPTYVVDHHGDPDLYWYEPSGAHGLIGSADPEADFTILRDYVIASAGAPVTVTGPFNFSSGSTLATFQYATFTYVLCDFFSAPDDDPGLYTISAGSVDDGIEVLVNGAILGYLTLGQSGSWPLTNALLGERNTLVVILVDDSAVDRYLHDLAFYRDGVMVQ